MIRRLIAAARTLASSPARPHFAVAGTILIAAGVTLVQKYMTELGEHAGDAEARYAELVDKHDDLAAEYRNGQNQLSRLRHDIRAAESELELARANLREPGEGYPGRLDLNSLGAAGDSSEAAG